MVSGLGWDIWNKSKESLVGLFQDRMAFGKSELRQQSSGDSKKQEWEKLTRHMAFLSVSKMISCMWKRIFDPKESVLYVIVERN